MSNLAPRVRLSVVVRSLLGHFVAVEPQGLRFSDHDKKFTSFVDFF